MHVPLLCDFTDLPTESCCELPHSLSLRSNMWLALTNRMLREVTQAKAWNVVGRLDFHSIVSATTMKTNKWLTTLIRMSHTRRKLTWTHDLEQSPAQPTEVSRMTLVSTDNKWWWFKPVSFRVVCYIAFWEIMNYSIPGFVQSLLLELWWNLWTSFLAKLYMFKILHTISEDSFISKETWLLKRL